MDPQAITLPVLVRTPLQARSTWDPSRAILVGLSGIDGAGKGWLSQRLARSLEASGQRIALLHADGWLNLPHVGFDRAAPALHFYRHALRLDQLIATLLLPLQATRSLDLVVDHAEETATAFRPHHYRFSQVDLIVTEGIYLFKREFRAAFDFAIWVDCSFETALRRAILRAQESLPSEDTAEAYHTIYLPAQRHHLTVDRPRDQADYILPNDARVG